jgi:predicted nucleic acid-binding protein
VFVDTNVLIYARDLKNAEKRDAARAWLLALGRSGLALTNLQVINELCHAVLRKDQTADPAEFRESVAALREWGDEPLGTEDHDAAWPIRMRFGFQWFDCLLIAYALRNGCDVFLTEDMVHDLRIGPMRLVDPFRVLPEAIFPNSQTD